jgi:hypothetical protein
VSEVEGRVCENALDYSEGVIQIGELRRAHMLGPQVLKYLRPELERVNKLLHYLVATGLPTV